jgi:hypothetical protein
MILLLLPPPIFDHHAFAVAQLYMRVSGTRSPSPLLNLRAFERTQLKSGASTEVSFVLAPMAWAVVDDGEDSTSAHDEGAEFRGWMLQPANVTVWVGGRQPGSNVPVGPGGQTSDMVQVAHFAVAGPEKKLDQRSMSC